MKRYRVTLDVELEVEADSHEDAEDKASDEVGCGDVTVVDVTQLTCEVPPGAERWADGVKAIWFGQEPPFRFGAYDGSWWWTNGHVALRCDGEPPSLKGWSEVPVEKFAVSFSTGAPFEPVEIGDAGTDPYADQSHPISNTTHAGVARQYVTLVSNNAATWLASKSEPHSPLHCLDAEGRLVAIVMPVRR